MNLIEKKAWALSDELVARGVDKKYAIDPLTILAIIQVLIELVKLMQWCQKTPPSALQIARNPNIVQRWWLKRTALDKLGREMYNKIGNQVLDGVKTVAEKSTVDDMIVMYKEVE